MFKFSTYKEYNPAPQKSETMKYKIKIFDSSQQQQDNVSCNHFTF